jgi:OTU-like cysteine protease
MSTALDRCIIDKRNSALNSQLCKMQLYPMDVKGDGNCFFRAISVGLYGHENQHRVLRQSVAEHLKDKIFNIQSEDVKDVYKHVADVSTDGVWVGENVIVATADHRW